MAGSSRVISGFAPLLQKRGGATRPAIIAVSQDDESCISRRADPFENPIANRGGFTGATNRRHRIVCSIRESTFQVHAK